MRVAKNQLPRFEIVNVLKQYNAGGGGTEKLTGDLSAGLVVAGEFLSPTSLWNALIRVMVSLREAGSTTSPL